MNRFYKDILDRNIRLIGVSSVVKSLALVFELATIFMVLPVLNGKSYSHLLSLLSLEELFPRASQTSLFIVIFLFFGLIYSSVNYFSMILINYSKAVVVKQCQERLILSATQIPAKSIAGLDVSTLNHVLTKDINRMAQGVDAIIVMPSQFLSVLCMLIIAFFLSVKTVLGILAFIVIVAVFYVFQNKKIKKKIKESMESSKAVNKKSLFFFGSLKFLSANTYIKEQGPKFTLLLNHNTNLKMSVPNLKAKISLFYETFGMIFISIYLFTAHQSGADFKIALVLLGLYFRISPSIMSLKRSFLDISESKLSYESYLQKLDKMTFTTEVKKISGLKNLDIRFQDIIVDGIRGASLSIGQLNILQGDKVFIQGHSGAGKSTLIDILLGCRIPSSGHAYIGQFEACKYDFSEYISYLSSDVPLTNGTIRENINLGKKFKDEDLKKALSLSGLDIILKASNHNLDSIVDVNNLFLSQGERQRLNLARIIVRDSPVWLLDESTNSLDSESEKIVFEKLIQQNPSRTIIFVSHKGRNKDLFNKKVTINCSHATEDI